MNKNKIAVGAFVLALVVGAGWAFGFFGGKDPQLVEIEQMRDEAFKNRETMQEEERRGQRRQIWEKVGQLSDQQRKKFFESSRPMFQRMMNERMNQFFAMSEEEQKAELDKWIDRMENRDSDRGGQGGGGGPRWGGEGMSQQQRDRRRQERLDSTTPELRAKFDKFKDMMNDRRKERGLPPVDRPWGGRGRR